MLKTCFEHVQSFDEEISNLKPNYKNSPVRGLSKSGQQGLADISFATVRWNVSGKVDAGSSHLDWLLDSW